MWSPRSLLFTLCIAVSFVTRAGALISVYGYEGKDVHVSCPYGAGYESYVKYFCKNDCYNDNDVVIKTQANKAKYSIHDDKTRRVFTVTISDLSQTDARKYWCVVERNGKDLYTEVKLKVSKDTCCDKSTKVQTQEDASVSFICPYESKDENNLKYICRGNQTSICLQQALVNSTSPQNGRFGLTDDKASRRFTVTITNLIQGDTGSYLCGANRDPGLDVFTAVDLDVKEWCCVTTNQLNGTVGRPLTLQCPYPPQHKDNRKFLCKGDHRKSCTDMVTSQSRFTLQENVSSSSFSVMVTELQAGDAGTYWCGSDSQWSPEQYTKIQLSVDTCCGKSTKVQTHEDASVSFTCPYESKDENNLKYICRGNQTSICLQQALVNSTSPQNKRFRLTDDKASRRFTVTITNLTQGDTGLYLCGAHRGPGLDVFTAVDLDVKEWCCVTTNKLNGTVGRPLTLQCPYPQQHKDNRKFLCKGDHRMSCTDMVTSQSRFTLQENVSSSSFSVMVTELQSGDAGTYWCGSDSQWSPEQYTKIQLSVDTCCGKSTKVQTHEDASISFTCPYESKDENNLKYICRGNQTSICLQQALVNSTSPQNKRFRLTDDKASRRFTVTITNLNQGDTGLYLCGAHRGPGLDVFTAVDLDVKEWCCVTTNKLNGTVGCPLTLQCPYPQQHKDNRKFLCKGDHRMSCTNMVTSQSRFTLQENVSSSSFSVMVTELQAGDAGTYWCGSDSQWSPEQYTKIQLSVVGPQLSSTVIPLTATEELNITEIKDAPATLTVVLTISAVLLILTVALIIACKYKCHKAQGAGDNMNMDMDKIRNKTAALEAEEVMGGEDVYANHDIVANSKQGTSYNDYDDAGDDSMYQNFSTADDIYCNQVYVTAKR